MSQLDKPLPRLSLEEGVLALWKRSCRRQLSCRLNLFPHSLQLKGLSPVWTLWCVFRRVFCVKRFPHSVQRYGLTPVWLRWCASS